MAKAPTHLALPLRARWSIGSSLPFTFERVAVQGQVTMARTRLRLVMRLSTAECRDNVFI